MKVGFGKVVITPPVGSSLQGYFQDRRSVDIRDDLYASCVAFDDNEDIFVVISCDLCNLSDDITKKVREILLKENGIKKSNVLIHATHTHTGPVIDLTEESIYTKGFYIEKSYLEVLPFYIASSVKIALRRRQEAKIAVGKNEVDGISFNRRYLMKDGRVITNPFNQIENIVKPAGEVDKTLTFLKIDDNESGKTKGIIVNFALHPDTLGDNLISSDWPGFLRDELKKEFGEIEVIVLNGPSGDINHINPFDYKTRSTNIGKEIAKKITEKVKEKIDVKATEIKKIQPFYFPMNLDYREITEKVYRKAKEILKKKKKTSLKYMIASGIVSIYKEKRKNKSIKVDINGVKIGDKTILIGICGEIFVEIGMNIKKILGIENTIIAQNSNWHLGYIPTKIAFQQYEKNLEIKEIEDINLSEAIGINTSYETLPMASKVNKNTEEKIYSTISKIKAIL